MGWDMDEKFWQHGDSLKTQFLGGEGFRKNQYWGGGA